MARSKTSAKKSATATAKITTPKTVANDKTNTAKLAPVLELSSNQMIPLNKLELSPKNVRKVPPSEKDDAELLATIREQGMKQNLVVHDGGKGLYLVDAGGRRLKALQTLASEGGHRQLIWASRQKSNAN